MSARWARARVDSDQEALRVVQATCPSSVDWLPVEASFAGGDERFGAAAYEDVAACCAFGSADAVDGQEKAAQDGASDVELELAKAAGGIELEFVAYGAFEPFVVDAVPAAWIVPADAFASAGTADAFELVGTSTVAASAVADQEQAFGAFEGTAVDAFAALL